MSYYRRRPRRRFASNRAIAASEEARLSVRAIKSLSGTSVGLPDRLFDWLRYPFQRRAFLKILEEKFEGFPWLAQAWADYRKLEGEREALRLSTKRWPAPQAAVAVREKGNRVAEAERRARLAEYLLIYYESLFPWLVEFRSEDVDELLATHTSDSAEGPQEDPARKWLTEAEYRSLPATQKYQLALDRYWQKRKSRWELGRDYERYIGYRYESDGFAVRYHGIAEGFEDLGRDLIASKGTSAEVVQCKYWSQHKTIHEKHIFQLFGTMTAYRVDNPKENVIGKFVTSTHLSDRARQFADILDIAVDETIPLEPYPCIKCNVSHRAGEKIYHLPFDQQYDRTIVEEERLECYVSTVAEAEALGFRRAHRWLPDSA